ncbi:MAG TPA: ATP-binding cassette domain-containing protein [Allosphingosinicella sp.]|jgi:ABC-type nitrate/sulfonate/bicarbonate transport system ATPase subunit
MPDVDSRPAVRLADCSVRFDGLVALDRVSLAVARQEVLALLGPSGSGKTTILRAITGAVPMDGERVVSGRVGIVYQDLKLLPWLTVLNNVMLSSEVPIDPDARESAVALIDALGLEQKLERFPYELSGGQRQRVAIARALHAGADILLLDEPFSALDFLAKARLITVLENLRKHQELTLILVTHDVDDALNHANRVVVLRQGTIVGDLDHDDLQSADRSTIRTKILALYGE